MTAATLSLDAPGILHRPLLARRAWLGFGIILLNLIDAAGTLANLSRGAEELNPLMLALLCQGPEHFVVVKHLLASIGVVGILAHPGARASRIALWILFPLYTCIALYQVALVLLVP